MEKRLFLAATLSFILLYAWTASQPKQKIKEQEVQMAEGLEVQEATKASVVSKIYPLEKKTDVETTPEPVDNEILTSIEGEKLKLDFSNKGATLKNAYIKNYEEQLPVENIASLPAFADKEFSLVQHKDNFVEYVYEDTQVRISKTIEIAPDDYIVQTGIEITPKEDMSNQSQMSIVGLSVDVSRMDKLLSKKDATTSRDKALYEYMIYTDKNTYRKNKAYKFNEKNADTKVEKVNWVGFRNRYYCAIVKPLFDVIGYSTAAKGEKALDISLVPGDLKKGESVQLNFVSFIGPEKIEILKEYGQGFENSKRYYKLGIFDAVAKIIRSIMFFIHRFVPNWGVCIILLSVLVYLCTYPMTARSMLAMKKMQALNPKITALREKHKNNPQKLNKETMELYKEHKVNPMGGCLPMFFQMPIFLGLLQVLWRNVELKGATFLWIKDLSAPDRLIVFSNKLPLIGNELNILPLLMIVIMFLQQKASARNMAVTDEAQRKQQQMMTILFPILFGFIFYKFASGLCLYFTMYYIFSTYSQFKLSKATGAKND